MNVSDLIKLLEPYKDLKVSKKYTVEINGDKLTLKQVRRTTKTKAEIMAEVVRKIENKEHTYNFREFAYAFEHFCQQFGYAYSTRLQVDQQAIKKVFPNHKSFGREELVLVYTYIRIFEKQVKKPTYLSHTLGGMVVAIQKIKNKDSTPQV